MLLALLISEVSLSNDVLHHVVDDNAWLRASLLCNQVDIQDGVLRDENLTCSLK